MRDPERPRDLERDRGPADLVVADTIDAVDRKPRVHDDRRGGQIDAAVDGGRDRVVVEDQRLEPEFGPDRDRLVRRDPAVDRDQQVGALFADRADALDREAVAGGVAVRQDDLERVPGREQADHPGEDARSGDAVEVVVAVDRDPLATGDRVGESPSRRLGPGQTRWRDDLGVSGIAEADEVRHRPDPEQPIGQRAAGDPGSGAAEPPRPDDATRRSGSRGVVGPGIGDAIGDGHGGSDSRDVCGPYRPDTRARRD